MGLADTDYNKGIKSKKEEKKHIHSHNSTPSAFLPPTLTYLIQHDKLLEETWHSGCIILL